MMCERNEPSNFLSENSHSSSTSDFVAIQIGLVSSFTFSSGTWLPLSTSS